MSYSRENLTSSHTITTLVAATLAYTTYIRSPTLPLTVTHVALLLVTRSPIIAWLNVLHSLISLATTKPAPFLFFAYEGKELAALLNPIILIVDVSINMIAAILLSIRLYKNKSTDIILENIRYISTRKAMCKINPEKLLTLALIVSLTLYTIDIILPQSAVEKIAESIAPLTPSYYDIMTIFSGLTATLTASTIAGSTLEFAAYITILALVTPFSPHALLAILALSTPLEAEIALLKHLQGPYLGIIRGYIPLEKKNTLSQLEVIGVKEPYKKLRKTAPYTLNIREAKHILIAGMTGYGKTTTAAKIAHIIAKTTNAKVIIIDPHGEYGGLLENLEDTIAIIDAMKTPLNPLDHMGLNPSERIAEIAAFLKKLYKLGPIQLEILYQALREAYEMRGIDVGNPSTWGKTPPTILDLLKILRAYARSEQRAAILANHIEALWNPELYSKSVNLGELIRRADKRVIVLDLSRIPTREQQAVYIETILKHLYNYSRQEGITRRLRLMIVLDEAHLVSSKDDREDILARYTAELRKYGTAITIVLQNPNTLSETTLENISLKILFRIAEPKIAEYIAKYLASTPILIDNIRIVLPLLPKYHALVVDDTTSTPLIVHIAQDKRKE